MIGQVLRRAIVAMVLSSFVVGHSIADPLRDGRIAIVDISDNLLSDKGKPFTDRFDILKKSGVLVIGRYFGRCQQSGALSRKRLIDGDPKKPDAEANAILENGFAIMSIYQYYSREDKFDGALRKPQCITVDKQTENRISGASNVLREAILDAKAAIQQAGAVHQPIKTVIYFGVDYSFNKSRQVEVDGLLTYFSEVKDQLDAAHYRVGAYGGGDALSMLREKHLIDVAWIAPSASYKGSSDFHTRQPWQLFQSEADNHVLISNENKCLELEYDVNIQNVAAANEDLGFWNKNGSYKVPVERTTAIFNQRRFVCDRRDLYLPAPQRKCDAATTLMSCVRTPVASRVMIGQCA